MKILMYTVRPDEQGPISDWNKQHTEYQIGTNSLPLNAKTVDLAKGMTELRFYNMHQLMSRLFIKHSKSLASNKFP